MQPSDSRQGRWVPFDQARMILRMSEGTLRRAIKDGTVVAEQRRRNPESTTDLRMVYEVLVPDPPASANPTESAPATLAPDILRIMEDRLSFADTLIVANGEAFERQAETIDRLYRELRDATASAARADERAIAADRRADAAERERAELRREIDVIREQVIAANAERDARVSALEWTQAQLDQARAEVERLKNRRWYDPRTW